MTKSKGQAESERTDQRLFNYIDDNAFISQLCAPLEVGHEVNTARQKPFCDHIKYSQLLAELSGQSDRKIWSLLKK